MTAVRMRNLGRLAVGAGNAAVPAVAAVPVLHDSRPAVAPGNPDRT